MRYFRRFRMEFDFSERALAEPDLPEGYEFSAWSVDDLDRHAQAKFLSFHEELDSMVFPCLGTFEGCQRLMLEIASQRNFLPEATWLVSRCDEHDKIECGTIQGMANSQESGSVQNIGVIPTHRGLGIGRALMLKALHGFKSIGLQRVHLEATAENPVAVELYRSIGFRLIRTTYKQVTEREQTS
jgi:GNAT superfamily N-acetyltransferase